MSLDRVVIGLNATFAYLVNMLITLPSMEQHLAEVFSRLQAAWLIFNGEKCIYAVKELDFLGHRTSAAGITPQPHRLAALQQHLQPATVKDLQGFLGTVNFYRRCVPAAPKILTPCAAAPLLPRRWGGRWPCSRVH
jgi:putative transposase